jgi:N-formylglutamate deformylase
VSQPTEAVFTLSSGSTPLVLSLPHVGTAIPDSQQAQYVDRALLREDTDWHLAALYDFAGELGATVLVPRYSRYVIDLNRPPDDQPMYPGAANTELCPTRFFNGDPLYREGQAPDAAEIARRRVTYWQPYHDALRAALQQARDTHGYALLWDGHSIRSQIPWLFEGKLPDFNLGTASATSCAPSLRERLTALLQAVPFTHAIDGRFRGGYITRHYGRPEQGVHAVQMEICQSLYMQELPPFGYEPALASRVKPLLRDMLGTMLAWTPR